MYANRETLKNVCCTCLTNDRKLIQLFRVEDGINMLNWLFSFKSEYNKEEAFKNESSLYVCWECEALLLKILRFRHQVCAAQTRISSAIEEQDGLDPHWMSLSRLSYNYKQTYNRTYIHKDEVLFIDCGTPTEIKSEIDIEYNEPLPLSTDIEYTDYKNHKPDESQIIFDNVSSDISTDYIDKKPDITDSPIKIIKVKTEPGLDNKSMKGKVIDAKSIKKSFGIVTLTENKMKKARELAMMYHRLNNAKFKCASCILCFDDESQFDQHNKERHSKNANCLICNSYIGEASISTHTVEHYRSYQCKNCSYETQSYDKILTHSMNCIIEKKAKDKVFTCNECERNFDSYRKRWNHIQTMHREGHQCSKCEKKFSTKSLLFKHMLCHDIKPPRKKCPNCTKMVRIDTWNKHMQIHFQRETFSCEECNKKFISRASYLGHLKFASAHAHKNYLTHKCLSCEKAFRTAIELQDHVNFNHIGKTRHKCPECDKPFSSKRAVSRHFKTVHKGIKENTKDKICQQCGLAFYTRKNLLEHELIHSGERPLSCDVCGSTFRQRSSLYAHRKRVHNVQSKRKTAASV